MNNIPIIGLILAVFNGVQGGVAFRNGELCFPKNFYFGVATASYQIEGAWNVSGKSESIWDRYTHEHPERIFDHKNGDVAADSYHRFREDVKLMADLGVKYYRFSISWPRVLPTGLANEINEDGIRYYRELINELNRNKLMALVTMYHWDLPQSLQDLGGWTNPIMADYFVDYARVLIKSFEDMRVDWITFNEPLSFCQAGYGGMDAPGANASGFEDYLCGHNVLRAHGMAYRMYKREFPHLNGAMGITIDMGWQEPATTSPEDQEAAETARQFYFGWFANPIFSKTGDYPAVMRKRVDEASRQQRYPRSRLPTFTAEEVEYMQGSADFLGLNHYTTYLISPKKGKISPQPSFVEDAGIYSTQKEDWPKTNSTWLRVVPWGFRKALNWIKRTYENPIVLITENGVSTPPGLHDRRRTAYILSYLRALHAAIALDGCRVVGYTYWSLIDNFEWTRGFSERFGLYEVDYSSPNKTRTARESVKFFSHIAKTGCLPTLNWVAQFQN
ncbi:myrosinase 1-like isoform X2 [Epargyreus clarus]|uniref:myrosinase 1-like isoform X2 n=1 Tax=Epargyreus clarus TaxID=520877 RepID=UPI003C2ADE34